MVARIGDGDNIEKAIRYNEQKVSSGQAVLLAAEGFPLPASDLQLAHKIKWFEEITSRNTRAEKNSIHIVLSFHRKDKLNGIDLEELAREYMHGIGFGEQPYLLYKHRDTANPHLHIVTTNIRQDSSRIDTHLIGKLISSPVRERMEIKYNLIKARGRREHEGQLQGLTKTDLMGDPIRLRGKLRNIVRTVFETYHYGSFDEYAITLQKLGIKADRGEVGSRMYEYEGLVYAPLGIDGEQAGKSIKASQIYTSPTLKRILDKLKANTHARQNYRGRARFILQQAMAGATTMEMLEQKLKVDGIELHFHVNEAGRTYGMNVIDHVTRNIFKGSELGKGLSAAKVLQQVAENGNPELAYNRIFVAEQMRFPKGKYRFPSLVASWKSAGLRILPHQLVDGKRVYFVGHRHTASRSFIQAPVFMQQVLDRMSNSPQDRKSSDRVNKLMKDISFWDSGGHYFLQSARGFWEANTALLEPTPEVYDLPPQELLKEARKKKRKKRRD